MSTQTRTVNAGPVGLKPKGAYNSGASYTLLDTVLYKHDSWVCKAMNTDGSAATISGIAPDDATYGATSWQALTDGGAAAFAEGETARQKGLTAESQGNTAATKASEANTAAQNANTKAALADEKATLADEKASLANEKANLANNAAASADTAAALANEKAALANTKAELADEKATLADTKAQYAQTKGDYADEEAEKAKEFNDHPPYIADGTQEKPGDEDYWYIWDVQNHVYVKSAYGKGDDLHWEEMSTEEKEALAQRVLAELTFASDETCEDIIDELT